MPSVSNVGRPIIIILILAVSELFAFGAGADSFLDGNKLQRFCREDKAIVIGYVAGVHEANSIAILTLRDFRRDVEGVAKGQIADAYLDKSVLENSLYVGGQYCLPSTVILNQLVDVLCQHLDKNPSERHMTGHALTTVAFMKAWPCKTK